MAKPKALLWALAKEHIQRYVKDPYSVVLLVRELEERGKRASVVAYEFNGRVLIQFAAAPKPVKGAKRIALTRVNCSDLKHDLDADLAVSGRDLRWALIYELARTWPEWAGRPVRHRSEAAQRVETLIQGGHRSVVRVGCKISKSAR